VSKPASHVAGEGVVPLGAAASPVSISAISPPQQGDALSGLTLAIGGVGPATGEHLPHAAWPTGVLDSDAWVAAVGSETGWYVLLTQDCDIVREPAREPTVLLAPLVLVDKGDWNDLSRNGYSSRRYAYPSGKFSSVPAGKALVVDLAWTTSVLKGSLGAPSVKAVRPLTGPNKRSFSEWLAARAGRAPFPEDVVDAVLDPCYDVRKRLSARYDTATAAGSAAPAESRAVAAAERWFAHRDGRLVTIFGQVSGRSLTAANFVGEDGAVLTADLARAEAKLQSEIIKRMNRVDATSGYQIKIKLVDLATLPASQFVEFALLVR
jgi:hypothetical protein